MILSNNSYLIDKKRQTRLTVCLYRKADRRHISDLEGKGAGKRQYIGAIRDADMYQRRGKAPGHFMARGAYADGRSLSDGVAAFGEPAAEAMFGERLTDVKSLGGVTTEAVEHVPGHAVLNALGDNLVTQVVPQVDD